MEASRLEFGVTCRSCSSWPTRSEETVRRAPDWPTSVARVSARYDPTQSSEGSPEALRKGRIASDTEGPRLVCATRDGSNLSRHTYPLRRTEIASAATTAIIVGRRPMRAGGLGFGNKP